MTLNSAQLSSIAVMAGTLKQMIARRRSSGVNEYVAAMMNVNLENVSNAVQAVLERAKFSV